MSGTRQQVELRSKVNYGLFAPLPFRPLALSPPGLFVPWLIRPRTLDDSPPGLFAPVCGIIAIRRQKLYAYNLLFILFQGFLFRLRLYKERQQYIINVLCLYATLEFPLTI